MFSINVISIIHKSKGPFSPVLVALVYRRLSGLIVFWFWLIFVLFECIASHSEISSGSFLHFHLFYSFVQVYIWCVLCFLIWVMASGTVVGEMLWACRLLPALIFHYGSKDETLLQLDLFPAFPLGIAYSLFHLTIFSYAKLTLWELAYDIFVLQFRHKKQQFTVALPTP